MLLTSLQLGNFLEVDDDIIACLSSKHYGTKHVSFAGYPCMDQHVHFYDFRMFGGMLGTFGRSLHDWIAGSST